MLIGHRAELSNCLYNFDCSLVASSSMDKTAKVWDMRTNSCLATLSAHDDEVLDLAFNRNGRKLATASSDTTARVWNVNGDFRQLALMTGHREEISKGKKIHHNLCVNRLIFLRKTLFSYSWHKFHATRFSSQCQRPFLFYPVKYVKYVNYRSSDLFPADIRIARYDRCILSLQDLYRKRLKRKTFFCVSFCKYQPRFSSSSGISHQHDEASLAKMTFSISSQILRTLYKTHGPTACTIDVL